MGAAAWAETERVVFIEEGAGLLVKLAVCAKEADADQVARTSSDAHGLFIGSQRVLVDDVTKFAGERKELAL